MSLDFDQAFDFASSHYYFRSIAIDIVLELVSKIVHAPSRSIMTRFKFGIESETS